MSNYEFEPQQCIRCFVWWGVPKGFTEARRKDKLDFYCPVGHSMAYTENEADRLRRERDLLKQQAAQRDDEHRQSIERMQARLLKERDALESSRRQTSAQKGQITRLKNRAAAGVCPCCNRTFQNLQRHMSSLHPTFKSEEIAS